MRHLQTEIIINASPEKIWSVLMNFEAFPDWNPFIIYIDGEHKVGTKLNITVEPPTKKAMSFKPAVLACIPEKELRWIGKGPLPGLFSGEHYFKLEKINETSCKFIHGEKFKGILVGMMKSTLDKTEEGFQLMNEALKKECEIKK